MTQQLLNSVTEHSLNPALYKALVVGHLNELAIHLEKLQCQLPKLVEVFQKILEKHRNRHPNLEDWLIIPVYGFIWSNDLKRLEWIEGRFTELFHAIGEGGWSTWIDEIIIQTECVTTHRICDRIYDYFLHMYGALYLIRLGWNIHFLPFGERGPDIVGSRCGEECVMECKFKHISKKFESLFWRFDTACSRNAKKPLVTSAQFRFPDAEGVKELSVEQCLLLKEFVSIIYKDPEASHKGSFGNMIFEYAPVLPVATNINSQNNQARVSANDFFQRGLSRILDDAATQVSALKYKNHRKFLFVGIQPDPLFSMPWTDSAMRETKLLFALKAQWKHEIEAVFSDDVDFSVAGYL